MNAKILYVNPPKEVIGRGLRQSIKVAPDAGGEPVMIWKDAGGFGSLKGGDVVTVTEGPRGWTLDSVIPIAPAATAAAGAYTPPPVNGEALAERAKALCGIYLAIAKRVQESETFASADISVIHAAAATIFIATK